MYVWYLRPIMIPDVWYSGRGFHWLYTPRVFTKERHLFCLPSGLTRTLIGFISQGGWAHEVLFKKQECKGIKMCARSPHPLAEICLGYGVARNTLFCYLDCSGARVEMAQMLKAWIHRLQILKHLFLVIVFWDLIFLVFAGGTGLLVMMFFSRQVFYVRWWCWSLFIGKCQSLGLGAGWLSKSQAWDRCPNGVISEFCWGVEFAAALVLIPAGWRSVLNLLWGPQTLVPFHHLFSLLWFQFLLTSPCAQLCPI